MVFVQKSSNGGKFAASIGLSIIGAYITICFCEQFRLCSLGNHTSKLLSKNGLFALMTLSYGGVAIWSMNVIGLSDLSVNLPDGTPKTLKSFLCCQLLS